MSTLDEISTTLDKDALQWVLSTPNGRKVLWGILGFAGLYRQPRIPQDSEGTAFNCGSLNVALMIQADCLAVSPRHTAIMTEEQGNADRTDSSTDTSTEPSPRSGPVSDNAPGGPEDSPGLGFDRFGH